MKDVIGTVAGVMSLVCVFVSFNYLAKAIGELLGGALTVQSLVFFGINLALAIFMAIIMVVASKYKSGEQE